MSDRAQFVRAVVQALREAGETGQLAIDAPGFALVLTGDRRLQLATAFAEWSAAGPAVRAEIPRRFATMMTRPAPVPGDAARFRAGLLLQIRPLDDMAWLQAEISAHGGKGLASEPYGPDLALIAVFDHPESVTLLSEPELREHGLGVGDALQIARANLRQRSAGGFHPIGLGMFASPWRDAHDAARLVLTELISRLEVRGDPVALVPRNQTLLITGSDDPAGLAAIAKLAEPELSHARALTGHAFRWRAGAWSRFLPPRDAPAFVALHRMSVSSDAESASRQKTHLAGERQRAGSGLQVADLYMGTHKVTGAATSYCIWRDGSPRLLPRARCIVFARTATSGDLDDVATVAWADAVRIVGHRMIAQGLRPERWRVDSFPDAGELVQLAAANTELFA